MTAPTFRPSRACLRIGSIIPATGLHLSIRKSGIMFWKRKIVKVLIVIMVFVLALLLLMVRSEGDISCLYTTF